MNQIVAVTFNKNLFGRYEIIDSLMNFDGITEVLLFFNGTAMDDETFNFYKDKFVRNGVEFTMMENEVELEPDKVIRHIISYAHHNYSEGLLYIFRGSDKIKSGKFLGTLATESDGMFIKCDTWIDLRRINSIPDLFNLYTPFSFVPVISISNAKYALTSRNLRDFLKYIIENSRKKGNDIIYMSNEISESISDALIFSGRYAQTIISENDFEDVSTKKIIKCLLSNLQ